jgi:hypothetical protein
MSSPDGSQNEKQRADTKGGADAKERTVSGRDIAEQVEQSGCGKWYGEDSEPARELHICMGLNACHGLDVSGTADKATTAGMAGTGRCATVRHACHGEGNCRGQGGCGYAGSEYEQFLPGAQACRFNGSCASPLNVSRVFSAGPMKGKSVWKQARRLFEARMYEAKLAFGPPPGEGIPDDVLPRYDLYDIPPDKVCDPSKPAGGGGSC